MRRCFVLVALASILFGPMVHKASAQVLSVNSTATFTNINGWNGTNLFQSQQDHTGTPNSNSARISVGANETSGSLSGAISTLAAGTQYAITWWYMVASPNTRSAVGFNVSITGAISNLVTTLATGTAVDSWVQATTTFQTGASAVSNAVLTFDVSGCVSGTTRNDQTCARFDDINLKAVPSPLAGSGLLALVAGLFAVHGFRRRLHSA